MEVLSSLPYSTLFGIWLLLALFFATAYFGLTYANGGAHAPTGMQDFTMIERFFNSLYFSIITATSTGYGDITPQGFSKVLASLQSISALLVFAIFVTKLVSHHQEITLTEVHRLTFEDVFHNTREGMFICRKDFDHIIEVAQQEGALTEHLWKNLTSAYRHLQTLFEEIPDFYQNEMHRYTIDEKREQLLLEAAHRTLHRLNTMLDVFSKKGIDWEGHAESVKELQVLVEIVAKVTPLWHERSPYEDPEAFADIVQLKESMHSKMSEYVV